MEKVNKIQQISGPQALPFHRPLSSQRQQLGTRGSQCSRGEGACPIGKPRGSHLWGTGRGGWELPQGRMLGGDLCPRVPHRPLPTRCRPPPELPGLIPVSQRAQPRHRCCRRHAAATASRHAQALCSASTRANTKSLVQQINWEENGLIALLTTPGLAGLVS